jgi:hypothetical protein
LGCPVWQTWVSCLEIGSFIYVMHTYIRLNHSIRKLARFTQYPGRNHFKLLLHLLRHLQNKEIIKIRLRHEHASRADDPAWLTNERVDQHKDGKQNPPIWIGGTKLPIKVLGYVMGGKYSSMLRWPVRVCCWWRVTWLRIRASFNAIQFSKCRGSACLVKCASGDSKTIPTGQVRTVMAQTVKSSDFVLGSSCAGLYFGLLVVAVKGLVSIDPLA